MDHPTEVLLGLFVVYISAQIGGEIAQRLKLPSVVGQIAAGCAIGPHAFGWVQMNEPLEVFSELGAIFLLFSVGLETRLHDLKKVGNMAVRVGVLGVIFPFVLGVGWAEIAGYDFNRSAFIGAAFVATSAGITAKVLQELGALSRIESRIILGAAIIDDILAMLLLGVVTALQTSGGVDLMNLLKVLGQAIAFVLVVAVLGAKVMRRSSNLLDAPIDADSPLMISLAICLGLAAAAAYSGLAAIIGAFLAGMILAETDHQHHLEKQTKTIMAFVTPFFFAVTGTKVDLHLLSSPPVLLTVFLVTVLAIIGKIAGGAIGARKLGRGAWIVGIGMVPRGEVGIIVASLGMQAKVFSASVYAEIIAMSLLTSVFAPPLLQWLLKKPVDEPQPEAAST